jgi:hypothetical protein
LLKKEDAKMGLDMYLNVKSSYDHEDEIGYWRKANHIHQWFVENVQAGNDDCASYPVTQVQLSELLEVCNRVLAFKHLAHEQLPTKGGFFFGSIDYNEWYYTDVEQTIKIITDALALPATSQIYYQSSW